jgi:hypothetical protein
MLGMQYQLNAEGEARLNEFLQTIGDVLGHARRRASFATSPSDAHDGLLNAASKGAHFNRFIKHSFDFVRVSGGAKT